MVATTPISEGYVCISDYSTDDTIPNQELNGKTAGDDYLLGAMLGLNSQGKLDFEKELFYGGEGYGIRYDSINRIVTISLSKLTRAEHEDIWQYYYKHKDNKTSKDYLWIVFDNTTPIYYPFFNKSGTKRQYCEGFLTNVRDTWIDTENLIYGCILTFEEVLSG